MGLDFSLSDHTLNQNQALTHQTMSYPVVDAGSDTQGPQLEVVPVLKYSKSRGGRWTVNQLCLIE